MGTRTSPEPPPRRPSWWTAPASPAPSRPAHTLGGSLLALLSLTPDSSLPALLAEAITQVTDVHRHTCDVTNPISPSAALAVPASNGPAALIDRARQAEAAHATRPDDATIAHCTDLGDP